MRQALRRRGCRWKCRADLSRSPHGGPDTPYYQRQSS